MAVVTATLQDAIAELKLDAIAELALERRRLHDASDDLMASIDEFVTLTGGGWEAAIDELINVSFNVAAEPPRRNEVSAERLSAVRERLSTAGTTWAEAVAVIATLEGETLDLDRHRVDAATLETLRPRIDRRRLDAAFARIGHQGSPKFRAAVAAAYERVA